jgi:hypothetical protein
MNRRSVIKGGLVLAASSHTAVATADADASTTDPLIVAIADYEAGCAAFNALPDGAITRENEEGLVMATYGGPQDRLTDWNEPARTREGAIAALKFMEEQHVFCDQVGEAMRRAVLGYLEGLA